MEISERSLLIEGGSRYNSLSNSISGLSITFAIICIVDVFGVFPVVSLPKAIIDCGYIGIFVVVLVCCTQIYTAILLGKCWLIAENIDPSIHMKSRYAYSALAEFTYGNALSKFVTFLLDLTVFGGGIPNLIVASQNLQFLGLKLSENSFNMSFCYWMIILGTIMCPLLWFGSPKDMKILCTVSVTLVICVFILILSCVLLDTNTHNDERQPLLPSEFSLWQNILTAYGILAFQFDIHPTILTIQVDMKDKSKIRRAIIGGFAASLSLFVIICGVVFVRYGTNVGPSILEMLPSSVGLHFAASLAALQLGLSSAISNTALYQHIEDRMGIPRDFNHKRCIIRSVLAILSVLMAESVPRFDLVMSLIGGALTGPLVFILPPLFYIKMLSLQRIHEENARQMECFNIVYSAESDTSIADSTENVITHVDTTKNKFTNSKILLNVSLCSFIIVIGILATIATTYWNILKTLQYVTFSPPCIYNIYNMTFAAV